MKTLFFYHSNYFWKIGWMLRLRSARETGDKRLKEIGVVRFKEFMGFK
ncbi:hypothetical protein [Algoriphagus sp.]